MSDSLPPELPPTATETFTGERQWQALPARARALFVFGAALPLTVLLAIGGGVVVPLLSRVLSVEAATGVFGSLLGGTLGLVSGAVLGVWWGSQRYRYMAWTQDEQGLAVRRGNLWRQETRVPASRVQHLDIKRGPWQRRRHLSTLIVHTAGTRHSAVAVPHLDADDAERLRDRLARQIDHDD